MELAIKLIIAFKLINIFIFIFCAYVLLSVKICLKIGIYDDILEEKFKMKFKYIPLILGILSIKIYEYFE